MLDQAAPSILVVEPHDGSLGTFGDHLARSGSNLRHVDGVSAACTLLRSQWFPIVVASLPAPGVEALALLRAAQRSLPRSEVVFRFAELGTGGTALPAIRESAAAVVGSETSSEALQHLIEALLARLHGEAGSVVRGQIPSLQSRSIEAIRLERYRAALRPLAALDGLEDRHAITRFRLAIARAARDTTGAQHAWVVLEGEGEESVTASEPVSLDVPRSFAREIRLAARPISHAADESPPGHHFLGVPVGGDEDISGAIVVALPPDATTDVEQTALLVGLARELATGERIVSLRRQLTEARESVIAGLASALELRDRETSRHSQRVAELAHELAAELGYEEGLALDELRTGALLHDLGKIGIPDAILAKPGPLTNDEWLEMQRHPEHGWRVLQRLPRLDRVAELVLVSHERWDGRGYPRGLAGDDIPVAARIFIVADAWDSMISDRPYRRALPLDEALQEVSDRAGSQFDPEVVEAFFRVIARRFMEQVAYAKRRHSAA